MKRYTDLTDDDGELIVKASRKIVTHYLNNESFEFDDSFKKKFSFISGIFVTLMKQNDLRGCIGYPISDKELYTTLEDSAVAAATKDPRFPPLTKEELTEINFEVTILSEPEKISVNNPKEYPSKINIGKDGLIIKSSFSSGLLLPQVPIEYGWNEEEFLEHTCQKAGLEKNSWLSKDVTIEKFQGIVFAEESPNGKVVRKL
ncbi:TIGR00296 family protein [Nitrosopumilus sp. b1]|uniref:TIGR00296 family protein n=1 Tax=Nitrosopumilus sp. b1 TaxID=2109907 RepID=UPI0015F61B63|nr:TIGR00296 family protein [Nitrosopumilus sp. b1]KAF6243593.1 TIGR00296 family protein [Nitrosopumilus sp. b1]